MKLLSFLFASLLLIFLPTQHLSESSVAAAYSARFTPTKLSGKPVRVYGVIQYNFVNRTSR
jgi:hypothetical protein